VLLNSKGARPLGRFNETTGAALKIPAILAFVEVKRHEYRAPSRLH
jgi:hypothetical protein